MRIFFVRHGQSDNNALWARTQSHHGRVPDPDLTELGKRQLAYTAQFLDYCLSGENGFAGDPSYASTESGVVYLFCSLMERSIQSGVIIADRLNLPLVAYPDIHETGGIFSYDPDNEEYTGMVGSTPAFLQNRYPELLFPKEMEMNKGWWDKPFEKNEDSTTRAKRLVDTLKERHLESADTVILVSHGGFYNHFMWQVLGIQRPERTWFELFNGAITLVDLDEERSSVVYCNRYSFMPTEIVT
jgi:2,3-bisphosphoglycerate-dependent phosphoglycerate mutase